MNNSHEICFVTGNSDKSRDGLAILGDLYHQVRIVPIDLPEIQGEPDEIAITKAKEALKHSNGLPVIVEDSSLCINAFGGMPGPFIKFFLRKIKIQDLHLMLQSYEDKSASALSTIAIATSPEHVYVFQV
jgi:inosine triphosphate pyrophosphatase